jgi:hypothetical protein
VRCRLLSRPNDQVLKGIKVIAAREHASPLGTVAGLLCYMNYLDHTSEITTNAGSAEDRPTGGYDRSETFWKLDVKPPKRLKGCTRALKNDHSLRDPLASVISLS